ncbi:pistil-specific extensin-like protein [Oryza brachyantha]|uniref:pistil-specific extensin-like protein n=1 Tax=Oryza brachyantha TaxID=4533 RepID=UPI0007762A23|nr:pistil-specific extensin-like protein [Oryza brachyantha]
MALSLKFVVLSLAAVLVALDGAAGPRGGASAMGLPPPQPAVNFSIGVQGMVWCKTCRYPGYFPAMDASPLAGAVAYLRCRHGHRRAASIRAVAGSGGYFRIETSQLTSFTSQECKVYVPRSPSPACVVPGDGRRGLPLKFELFVKRDNGLQGLYSVGNFIFSPKYPNKCY